MEEKERMKILLLPNRHVVKPNHVWQALLWKQCREKASVFSFLSLPPPLSLSLQQMYNPTRLKVQLKLSINRLKMLQAKKTSLNQQNRREIGTLLEKGKEESARVRVEHIIRDDLLIEAMENLELYCDLLLARFGLLESYK